MLNITTNTSNFHYGILHMNITIIFYMWMWAKSGRSQIVYIQDLDVDDYNMLLTLVKDIITLNYFSSSLYIFDINV
jgi:uncharacterized membrane protein (DUF106 family)